MQDANDDLNTCIAGVSTGALYGFVSTPPAPPADNVSTKIQAVGKNLLQTRLRRSVIGASIGALASAAYILTFNRDKYLSK